MGNSCSTLWPLNICLNPSETSQSDDEYTHPKNLTDFAIISATEKHTATVSCFIVSVQTYIYYSN